jgi:hypothetical protein
MDLVIPESATVEAETNATCGAGKQHLIDNARKTGEKRGCRPQSANQIW